MADHIQHGIELEPAVLYELAAPSVPTEVRGEIAERPAAGETLSVVEVR